MDRLRAIFNRTLFLYLAFAALCWLLIDAQASRLKVLNFHRNAARYVDRYTLRPDVRYDAKKFHQAAIYQRGLIRLLPEQTLSYGALGYIYVQQGKWKAAARAYEQASRRHSDLFGFHFNRALVYYQLGDQDRAAAALKDALAAGPVATLNHHRRIAARMFSQPKLREAWLREKTYRLKSAHAFAGRLQEHIRSGQPMAVDRGQYYYYIPPLETGIIPLQAVLDGFQVP